MPRRSALKNALTYLAIAEEIAPHLPGPGQAFRLDRLAEEHDNVRAAFDWVIHKRRRRSRAASCRRDVAVLAGARTFRGGLGNRPACSRDARRRCAHARPGRPARCGGRRGLVEGRHADRRPLLPGAGRPRAPQLASRGPWRTRCSTSATLGSSATTRQRAKRSGPRRSANSRQSAMRAGRPGSAGSQRTSSP